MKRTVTVVFVAVALATTVMAQGGARGPQEGVWKVTEEVVTGAKASSTTSPQPSLFIFTPTHYSMLRVDSAQPRALFSKVMDPTNEEKIAAYDTFTANSGTYEVAGTTLTVRPIVAKNPNFMAGGFVKYEFRVDGNILWLTSLTGPETGTRRKLIRVE